MIAFQYQRITTTELFFNVRRPATHVSQHPQTSLAITKYKLSWLPSIMRDRKRRQLQIINSEDFMTTKQL